MRVVRWTSPTPSGRNWGGLLAFGCLVVSCGCGAMKIDSTWRQSAIVPDGSATDWGSELFYVEKLRADFGVVNDDSTLYLCVILRDRQVERQLAASGMEVWFEPQGSHAVPTGVHFPLADLPPGGGLQGEGMEGEGKPARARHEGGGDWGKEASERTPRPPHFRTDAVQILGDSTLGPMQVSDVPGLRVAVASSPSRAVVYELAMPLARTGEHPYAIGARPGDVVLVRLEVPTPSRPAGRAHGPGGAGGPGGEAGEPQGPGSGGGPPDGGGMGGPDDGGVGGGGMGGPGGHGGMGGPGGRGGMGGRPGMASEPWQAKALVKLALPN
jgi:hypothetical protein